MSPEPRYRFRFWAGPTQVTEIVQRLNTDASNRFDAHAGTEHVYGTVRLFDDTWPAQQFQTICKRILGFAPSEPYRLQPATGWTTCAGRKNQLPHAPCAVCGCWTHERDGAGRALE